MSNVTRETRVIRADLPHDELGARLDVDVPDVVVDSAAHGGPYLASG